MQKKWMINFLCMLIICIMVLTPGCIYSNTISSMGTNIDIDYDDIAAINYTHAQQELEKEGYRVEIITLQNLGDLESNREAIERDYRVYNELYAYKTPEGSRGANEWNFGIIARMLKDNTTLGKFSVTYFPVGEYAKDEKKAARHAEMVSDEVARICNLTIDWDKVSWSIDWSDGTGSSIKV